MAIKKYKIPLDWSETTARILNDTLDEIIRETQNKHFDIVSSKPSNESGINGEIRVDEANNKIYVKINGTWRETTLT